MKIRLPLILLLLLAFSPPKAGSTDKTESTTTKTSVPEIDVTLHSRVDTTNPEVRSVANLWINYIRSKPDSIYDNPYWNSEEKLKYRDFDFSRAFLYQFPSEQLLRYYKPTILAIEKEGELYSIRSLFAADGLEGIYRRSNPWCITKLYATKESGEWKLKNALPVITEKWSREEVGQITFHYPPSHSFDRALAEKANSFCNEIVEEFDFPECEPFEFYITDSGDELGRLFNFEFYFAGYTTGVGRNESRMLLSGIGSEYYPHEFVHMIVPKYERHWMIEEGFATWKGGTMGKTFNEQAAIMANELAKSDSVTFIDVLNKQWGWQYSAFYVSGAVFCKAAYDKGGVAAIKRLLQTPRDNEALSKTIAKMFEIEENQINDFWRKEILKFKSE